MAVVHGYLPSLERLHCETDAGKDAAELLIKQAGGWWWQDRNVLPIMVRNVRGESAVTWVLDSLTLATEHGRIDDRAYVRQLFSSEADLVAFLALLGDAQLQERHRSALLAIGLGPQMSTQADLRRVLENVARDVRW